MSQTQSLVLYISVGFLAVTALAYVVYISQSPTWEIEKHDTTISEESYYIGAVVEYQSKGSSEITPTPEDVLKYNAAAYETLIFEAAAQGAKIIVFPEYGLTSLEIPSNRVLARPYLLQVPPIGKNPCLDNTYTGVLKDLSCSARNNSIYVVLNLGEIKHCSRNYNCSQDGLRQYNTNVAFDNKGVIVSRYRKKNLYFESQFDVPESEFSVFKTDFGVEFGMFTCFDMIFKTPSVDLVASGIKNFIFTTAWVDELPFLTAIQAQSSWAFAADANLLASGYHFPQVGRLGSGIYSGRFGAVNYSFDPDSGTKLVLAKLPIGKTLSINAANNQKVGDERKDTGRVTHHYYLNEDLKNYTTEALELSGNRFQNKVICQDRFCCEFTYSVEASATSEVGQIMGLYRIAVFNGSRSVAANTDRFSTQICAIIRCSNETLASCSANNKNPTENLPAFLNFQLQAGPFITNDYGVQPALNTLDIDFNVINFRLFNVTMNEYSNSMKIDSNIITQINVQTIGMTKIIY